jgi:FkbM family methyltransferase
MLERKIKTSGGKEVTITSDDEIVIDWFANEGNQSDFLFEQTNSGIYARFMPKKNDAIIIDCGANIGAFSIFAQDVCSKLIAIEPDPRNQYMFGQLTEKFTNIILDRSALSNTNNTVKLNIHVAPTCNSIVYDTKTDLAVDVDSKTIGSIINEYGLDFVDFIKCDIEGAEILAITEDTIDPVKNKIGSWLIEIHQTDRNSSYWPGNLENNRQQIASILKNAGFQTESIIHDQLYAWK